MHLILTHFISRGIIFKFIFDMTMSYILNRHANFACVTKTMSLIQKFIVYPLFFITHSYYQI
jgi:hypothetical protein